MLRLRPNFEIVVVPWVADVVAKGCQEEGKALLGPGQHLPQERTLLHEKVAHLHNHVGVPEVVERYVEVLSLYVRDDVVHHINGDVQVLQSVVLLNHGHDDVQQLFVIFRVGVEFERHQFQERIAAVSTPVRPAPQAGRFLSNDVYPLAGTGGKGGHESVPIASCRAHRDTPGHGCAVAGHPHELLQLGALGLMICRHHVHCHQEGLAVNHREARAH